jgi:hypothetical protein
LSDEKLLMLVEEGIVLWHHISYVMNPEDLSHHISSCGIEVDPTKVFIIHDLPVSQKIKYVRVFLGQAKYYRIFIK